MKSHHFNHVAAYYFDLAWIAQYWTKYREYAHLCDFETWRGPSHF